MDHRDAYWLGRWDRGETGWHQDEVESELIDNFAGVAPTRVLVPLCGKSLDLTWLASQGHEVIGIELSDKACEAFFEENKMSPEVTTMSPFQVHRCGKVVLFCGDYFKLLPTHLGTIGAVYDRAALIALAPELRVKYTAHMTALLQACAQPGDFHFLQILWERSPHDSQGPPFSVTREQLERYYQKAFDIRLVKKEQLDQGIAERKTFQSVYRLRRWR